MSTLVQSQRPSPLPTQIRGTEGPKPTFWDTVGASYRLEEDRQELTQAPRNAEAYTELLETLQGLGVDTSSKGKLFMDAQSSIPGALGTHRVINRDAIYAEVLRQRQQDPKRFTQLPATREEYDVWIARRKGERDNDQITASRGGLTANLIGGMGSAMTEPYNLATLPLGAGQTTLVRTMLIEALVGMGTEPLNFASADRATKRMGEDYTAADKVTDVLVAGAAGGILGGTLRIAADVPERFELMITDNWDKLPEAVQKRWAKGATIADADLPDLAEAIIGRGNMSADELNAIAALRRDAEIDTINPFKRGMAGKAAHRIKLDDALEALLQPVTRQPRSFALPANPASDAPLSAGTSLSTSSGTTARSALKSKIRGVESGGNDAARNPLSSATGRYQFVRGTWLTYYKRRYGAQGLSDEAILAKRSDGLIQEQLMDDLTADNAAFLRSVGEAETAGNLYLTHFAGTGGAKKLFRADPSARAIDVLGAHVVKANPWMADYTAGDVIAWAHKKMNEAAPRRAGSRTELADDYGAETARLQAELDRIDAEEDAARAARAKEDPIGDALADDSALPDGEFLPVDSVDDLPPSPFTPPRGAEGLSDREMTLLPNVRGEVAGGAKLSDIAGMAKRLDATEDEVRRLLGRLAATEKKLLVQRKDGTFRRAPSDKGPVDAFKYIARAGGMADNEGHDLISIFGTEAPLRRKGRKGEADGVTMRKQSRLIPGAGPLVRDGGLPIDRVGELLFEGGYLRGAEGGRPTVRETLDYLERGMAGKEAQASLVPELDMGRADEWIEPAALDDMREHMREWAYYQEVELDGDDVDALALIRIKNPDLNEDQALTALANRSVYDALDAARQESDDYADDLIRFLEEDGGKDAPRLAGDIRDTRGEGVQYHGARGDVADLNEGYYNPNNIYGGFDTFYTTDALPIAGGYKRKRAEGKIYRVAEVEPVQFFDMEQPLEIDEAARIFGADPDSGDLALLAFDEAQKDGRANLREIMDEMRLLSHGEGISKDEVQEIFSNATYNLEAAGFGGMAHIGGLKTNNEPHQVKIYFKAYEQLQLEEVDFDGKPIGGGGSEPEWELNLDDMEQLRNLMARDGISDEGDALRQLTNDAIADALDDARYENGVYHDELIAVLDARDAEQSGARPAADTRDAAEGAARRAADADSAEADAIDLEGYDAADPAIAGLITDSVIHDLDADLAIFDGLGGRFFYVDEGGEARGWDDIKADLEQDAMEMQNMRNCL